MVKKTKPVFAEIDEDVAHDFKIMCIRRKESIKDALQRIIAKEVKRYAKNDS